MSSGSRDRGQDWTGSLQNLSCLELELIVNCILQRKIKTCWPFKGLRAGVNLFTTQFLGRIHYVEFSFSWTSEVKIVNIQWKGKFKLIVDLSLLSLRSLLSRSPRFQILCKAPISCERLQIVLSWKRCPAEKSKKFLSHHKMNWSRSEPRTIKPFLWPTFKSLLFPISTIPSQREAKLHLGILIFCSSSQNYLATFPIDQPSRFCGFSGLIILLWLI